MRGVGLMAKACQQCAEVKSSRAVEVRRGEGLGGLSRSAPVASSVRRVWTVSGRPEEGGAIGREFHQRALHMRGALRI